MRDERRNLQVRLISLYFGWLIRFHVHKKSLWLHLLGGCAAASGAKLLLLPLTPSLSFSLFLQSPLVESQVRPKPLPLLSFLILSFTKPFFFFFLIYVFHFSSLYTFLDIPLPLWKRWLSFFFRLISYFFFCPSFVHFFPLFDFPSFVLRAIFFVVSSFLDILYTFRIILSFVFSQQVRTLFPAQHSLPIDQIFCISAKMKTHIWKYYI